MRKNALHSEETFDAKNYGKRLISAFLIFIGAYLSYASSLIIFQVFVAKLGDILNHFIVILVLIIGLSLTITGVGRFEKKEDGLLYLSIPLMSFILGFLFTLAPASWHGKLFGGFSLFFFPLILFVFYCLKNYLLSDETNNFV